MVPEYADQMGSFSSFYLQRLLLIREVIGQLIHFIELNGLLMGSFCHLPKLLKWYTSSLSSFEFYCYLGAYSYMTFFQVPVVMYSEEGCFPGLYCTKILSNPWLSDGTTLILSTDWRSTEAIISVNVLR